MLMALLLNLLGFALLALSQPRHRERVYKSNGTVALAQSTQHAIGFIAVGLSLCASIASQGASFGSLLWVLLMSASAFTVAFTLAWRPHWLRGLCIFSNHPNDSAQCTQHGPRAGTSTRSTHKSTTATSPPHGVSNTRSPHVGRHATPRSTLRKPAK